MNKVVIDGKTYIPEDEALGATSQGVAVSFVGKNVIVRSRNEGINAGTVVAADRSGVHSSGRSLDGACRLRDRASGCADVEK